MAMNAKQVIEFFMKEVDNPDNDKQTRWEAALHLACFKAMCAPEPSPVPGEAKAS